MTGGEAVSHQGRNGYCISRGNDCFGWFGTTGSKSRLSFLDTMCGALDDHVLNDEAFQSHGMPRRALDALRQFAILLEDRFPASAH